MDGSMFSPLTEEESTVAASSQAVANTDTSCPVPITPVPAYAPLLFPNQNGKSEPVYNHKRVSKGQNPVVNYSPALRWEYRASDGSLIAHVLRLDIKKVNRSEKAIITVMWCRLPDQMEGWAAVAMPDPRPLFGLPALVADPDRPVLVTEGEKAADAAAVLFPDYVTTTTAGGSKAPAKTDFSPLADRNIIIWPDNDHPGRRYAEAVTDLAFKAGAASVRIVQLPPTLPEGWDLADPAGDIDLASYLENAVDAEPSPPEPPSASKPALPKVLEVEIDRPCFWTHEDWTAYGKPGLYYHTLGKSNGDKDPEPENHWICSPIYSRALTAGLEGRDHGLLLEFVDPFGSWKQWAAPMRLLKGSGEDLRGELLDQGVRIDPQAGRSLLPRWIMSRYEERRVQACSRVGWLPDLSGFVLPSRTIGPVDAIFQLEGMPTPVFATSGTLEGWRSEVAKPAIGNPLAVLAISAALAGPLLARLHRAGLGVHFYGDSSTGKSTLLAMAASVWGGTDFIRTWRATSNGLEGVAASINDTALVLDEISECDPKEVGAIVYSLGNGTGKSRANLHGSARPVHRWRAVVLSSGERTIGATMAEANKHQKVGQAVRLLDVAASRRFGCFDTLHQAHGGRSLADQLKRAAGHHFGHAGPAMIERLVKDARDLTGLLDQMVELPAFAKTSELSGRAATSFAVIALSGELAIEYGLVPWPQGEAVSAATEIYSNWRDAQIGNRTEDSQILDAIRDFLARHGGSRFDDADNQEGRRATRDRAGWFKGDAGDARIWLFTRAGLQEAAAGHDLVRITAALDRAGWIVEREAGKRSKSFRLEGNKHRLYCVQPKDLQP